MRDRNSRSRDREALSRVTRRLTQRRQQVASGCFKTVDVLGFADLRDQFRIAPGAAAIPSEDELRLSLGVDQIWSIVGRGGVLEPSVAVTPGIWCECLSREQRLSGKCHRDMPSQWERVRITPQPEQREHNFLALQRTFRKIRRVL